jgi:hypothetical protein
VSPNPRNAQGRPRCKVNRFSELVRHAPQSSNRTLNAPPPLDTSGLFAKRSSEATEPWVATFRQNPLLSLSAGQGRILGDGGGFAALVIITAMVLGSLHSKGIAEKLACACGAHISGVVFSDSCASKISRHRFMRCLLSAGARSLLLTLWDVNEGSTATFMKAFYNNLEQCSDRTLALQHAMRELREQYPHPYYRALLSLLETSFPNPLQDFPDPK